MQLVNHNATVDQTCSRKPNSSSVPKKRRKPAYASVPKKRRKPSDASVSSIK